MEASTVYEAFSQTARRTPDRDFLVIDRVTAGVYGIAPGAIPWGRARDEVDDLRARYAAAGWGHGHRVGLLLENRPDFFRHWLALNALGVSVVPINAEMRSAELTYLIGHSEMGLAVALPGRIQDLLDAARQAGRPLHAIPADAESIPSPAAVAPLAGAAVGEGTECALLYTSGTTGRPKGCILDNAYFLRAGRWYAGLTGVCDYRRDAERVMTPLPLTHMNAMANSAMVVIVAGGALIQLDRFHPKSWLESAQECGATIIHYLGVMPAMLLSAPPTPSERDHAIRWGFGAGVDPKHHAVFEERFGFPLVEAWAMTETGAAAVIMANREPRHVGTGCFGRIEDYMQLRLVDDGGDDVADGAPGEMLVRSSGPDPRRYFFRGYLKNPQATDEAWAGGWFHTGDMVRRDADGGLYFVDRKKNVIRRSGENISAVEVESVLNQHPAVDVCAVTAVPDAVRGDEVFACVVRSEHAPPGDEALAQDVVRHTLGQLAYYKAPGYVAFVDALPLTTSQKVQRGVLKQQARDLLERKACFDTRTMKKRQP
ncbi:MAG TPA: AMP-binding protein [Nevskiaceae bacterium]